MAASVWMLLHHTKPSNWLSHLGFELLGLWATEETEVLQFKSINVEEILESLSMNVSLVLCILEVTHFNLDYEILYTKQSEEHLFCKAKNVQSPLDDKN